jgi:hypothetical protein
MFFVCLVYTLLFETAFCAHPRTPLFGRSLTSLDTTPSRSDDSRESSGRLEMRDSLPNGDANGKIIRDESPASNRQRNGRKLTPDVVERLTPLPVDSIC